MTKSDLIMALLGAIIYAAGATYTVIRKLRGDREGDKLHNKSTALIDIYRQHAADALNQSNHLRDRLVEVEKERNGFALEVGELRATVQSLTKEVNALTITCKHLEDENHKLQITLEEQTAMMHTLLVAQEQLLIEMRNK